MTKLFFLFLLTLSASCTQNPAEAQTKLGPDEFEQLLRQDSSVQLIDVRTPEEFKAGYISHAQNLNFYDADFEQKIAKLDKTRPVAVYCAKGGRSASAAEKLKQAGFPKVFDLAGGMGAWKSAGKKTTQ
jgi:rhodanese-related sulfurtransferase